MTQGSRQVLDSQSEEVNPPGWPRPVHDSLPVPWITRVDPEGPAWSRVDLHRLLRCQQEWLCQVCGEALPERAWVVLDQGGVVNSDAALHRRCLALATAHCPWLETPPERFRIVEVSRADIDAGGEPLESIVDTEGETRTWRVL